MTFILQNMSFISPVYIRTSLLVILRKREIILIRFVLAVDLMPVNLVPFGQLYSLIFVRGNWE